jgi:hypothetical protein
LLIFVRMETHHVRSLAVTEPLETLTGLGVPQFHLAVVTTRQKLPTIIGECDVLDSLHMTMEGPEAISMCIHIPQLQGARQFRAKKERNQRTFIFVSIDPLRRR